MIRKWKKDIYTLKKRITRRNSSLGIPPFRIPPILEGGFFGKVSLCAFGKGISVRLKKAPYCGSCICVAAVFPWNGVNDFFYGRLPHTD